MHFNVLFISEDHRLDSLNFSKQGRIGEADPLVNLGLRKRTLAQHALLVTLGSLIGQELRNGGSSPQNSLLVDYEHGQSSLTHLHGLFCHILGGQVPQSQRHDVFFCHCSRSSHSTHLN